MHPEHYTDLDNLDTVENNLRHSAKGSNDAYDVTHSLTNFGCVQRRTTAKAFIDVFFSLIKNEGDRRRPGTVVVWTTDPVDQGLVVVSALYEKSKK